jgi:hypothetical protein
LNGWNGACRFNAGISSESPLPTTDGKQVSDSINTASSNVKESEVPPPRSPTQQVNEPLATPSRHVANAAKDKITTTPPKAKDNIKLLIIGSSNTTRIKPRKLLCHDDKDAVPKKLRATNTAKATSITSDMPYIPETLIFHVGTNDVNDGMSATDIVTSQTVLLKNVAKKLPESQIIWCAIPPQCSPRNESCNSVIADVNTAIATVASSMINVKYINNDRFFVTFTSIMLTKEMVFTTLLWECVHYVACSKKPWAVQLCL